MEFKLLKAPTPINWAEVVYSVPDYSAETAPKRVEHKFLNYLEVRVGDTLKLTKSFSQPGYVPTKVEITGTIANCYLSPAQDELIIHFAGRDVVERMQLHDLAEILDRKITTLGDILCERIRVAEFNEVGYTTYLINCHAGIVKLTKNNTTGYTVNEERVPNKDFNATMVYGFRKFVDSDVFIPDGPSYCLPNSSGSHTPESGDEFSVLNGKIVEVIGNEVVEVTSEYRRKLFFLEHIKNQLQTV